MKKSLFKKWEVRNNGYFVPSYNTTSRLPAGVYQILAPPQVGYQLHKLNIVTEKIVDVPMHEFTSIFDDIGTFWQRGSVYKENNMVYKRGILLFGKPGTGKSFIIQRLMKQLIEEKDGIVFSITSPQCLENYISFVPMIYRVIEPFRPTMVILEDVDELLYRGYSDSAAQLLNMLDGLRQVNGGTLYIATTNHPEKLEAHFKNRPGRFDIKRKIGLPTEEARYQFFFQKLNNDQRDKFDLKKWATDTDGLSLAHLKELIISVVIMNKDYEKSVASLKRMSALDTLKDEDIKLGF